MNSQDYLNTNSQARTKTGEQRAICTKAKKFWNEILALNESLNPSLKLPYEESDGFWGNPTLGGKLKLEIFDGGTHFLFTQPPYDWNEQREIRKCSLNPSTGSLEIHGLPVPSDTLSAELVLMRLCEAHTKKQPIHFEDPLLSTKIPMLRKHDVMSSDIREHKSKISVGYKLPDVKKHKVKNSAETKHKTNESLGDRFWEYWGISLMFGMGGGFVGMLAHILTIGLRTPRTTAEMQFGMFTWMGIALVFGLVIGKITDYLNNR